MQELVFCDCLCNAAYLMELRENNTITDLEYAIIQEGLKEIALLSSQNAFQIHENPLGAVDQYLKVKFGSLALKLQQAPLYSKRLLIDLCLYMRGLILDLPDMLFQKDSIQSNAVQEEFFSKTQAFFEQINQLAADILSEEPKLLLLLKFSPRPSFLAWQIYQKEQQNVCSKSLLGKSFDCEIDSK